MMMKDEVKKLKEENERLKKQIEYLRGKIDVLSEELEKWRVNSIRSKNIHYPDTRPLPKYYEDTDKPRIKVSKWVRWGGIK